MKVKIYRESIVRDYNFKYKKDCEDFITHEKAKLHYKVFVLYNGTDYIIGGYRVTLEYQLKGWRYLKGNE